MTFALNKKFWLNIEKFNQSKTICRPVRSEYSSCSLLKQYQHIQYLWIWQCSSKGILYPSVNFIPTAYFLILMKDEWPKVFKLTKTNSALNFLKNNTSLVCSSKGIIFDKIQGIVFYQLRELINTRKFFEPYIKYNIHH